MFVIFIIGQYGSVVMGDLLDLVCDVYCLRFE